MKRMVRGLVLTGQSWPAVTEDGECGEERKRLCSIVDEILPLRRRHRRHRTGKLTCGKENTTPTQRTSRPMSSTTQHNAFVRRRVAHCQSYAATKSRIKCTNL